VRIEHAHLEEDAAKLTHFEGYSLVDLNRAGTPLVEIVSMPDIHSTAQARLYCEELHRLMIYADVTNGDLYHGNMRFDVNISVAAVGAEKLGTRVEIKNLNSFRSVERVAQHEFERQVALLEKGEEVEQETRGWSDDTGRTSAQRSKEDAQDYRYMPEPDVPPIVLTDEFVRNIEAEMPLMPADYRKLFAKMELDESEVTSVLNDPELAEKLAAVLEKDLKLAVRVAHWFSGLLLAEENMDKDFGLATVAELTALSEMVEKNELSSTAGKEVFLALYDAKNTEKTPRALAKEMNLLQENDEGALLQIIDEVLALPECEKAAEDVKNGEARAIGFLVGQVMKKSQGKANPATVNRLIRQRLE
jgi:aspartyl-tRNA(Asn)/glutamyl-tRNA(Gln) amidotransferase subunit B